MQVAWLGYPGTTGLRAIDYRITDAQMEPDDAPCSESAETPVRLPDSWFCFDPIDDFPPPGESPALRAGHVTFGCLNNFCKIQSMGPDDEDDILSCVHFLMVDVMSARRLIGDLSDRDKVIVGLNLATRAASTAWIAL